ncbi:MAG: hypothetical protein LC748_14290, partial [Thermomicrobia bacterium]|nr:hypothetical protein [Thermomicrobia bacterium]
IRTCSPHPQNAAPFRGGVFLCSDQCIVIENVRIIHVCIWKNRKPLIMGRTVNRTAWNCCM